MKSVAINLTLFKIAWLAVVFGAAASLAELGTAVVGAAVIVHLFRAGRPSREILLMLAAAVIGGLWESYLIQTGTLQYPGFGTAALAPYWIIAMWVPVRNDPESGNALAQKRTILLRLLLVLSVGPLSFAAGESAGAVVIAENGFYIIGIGWAILLPLMCYLASRLDGYAAHAQQRQLEGATS